MKIGYLGQYDFLNTCFGNDIGGRFCHVRLNHQNTSARVIQLMLELAFRVERVGVYHHHASTKGS